MRKQEVMSLFALLLLSSAYAQEPKTDKPKAVEWSALSIQIAKRVSGDERSFVGITQVTAKFRLPDRLIAGIDSAKSNVESFTDDKNTNFMLGPRIRPDVDILANGGNGFAVMFLARGTPALGSSAIRIKGTLTALVADSVKEIEKKDANFLFVTLPIGSVQLKAGGGTNTYLEYQGTRPLKSAFVVDSDGNRIDLTIISSRPVPSFFAKSSGFGEPRASGEYRATLSAARFDKGNLTRGLLSITYYDAIERVVVPIDLDVGLGL